MRKSIFSMVLLAACLLISTSLRAGVPAKIAPTPVTPQPFHFDKGAITHKPMMKKAALATSEEQKVYLTVLGKETEYTSFSDALAALPDNSTPATIKLGTDVSVSYNQKVYTIAPYKNITIDLNNHVIYASTDVKEGSEVFNNSGTLIIEDNSTAKGGKITSSASNPDLSEIPGYGSYTIINNGTLILNSGTIENTSKGGACYAVENRGNGHLIINGGTITTTSSNAIRMNLSGNTDNKITMNGGEITSEYYCVEIQHQSTGTHKAEFVMNDGTLRPGDSFAFVSALYSGKADFDNTSLIFNGGDIYGYIYFSNNPYDNPASNMSGWEKIEINGGVFHENSSFLMKSAANQHTYTEFIKGGTFCDFQISYIDIAASEKGELTDETEATAYYKENLHVIDYAEYAGAGWENSYGYYWAVMCGDEYVDWFDQPAGATQEQINNAIKESLTVSTYSDSYPNYWRVTIKSPVTSPYDAFQENDKNYIADGYKAKPISGVDETDGNDLVISVITEKSSQQGSGNWSDKNTWVKGEDESDATIPDAATNVTIQGGGKKDDGTPKTVITIPTGTKAEANKITGDGEAQIVVEDGAVLNVGNGGIVSENNDLVFVKVEAGGKLTVGNNGVDQQGDEYPIIVENNGSKSGVYMVSPNAKDKKLTEPEATVRVYTRAYMTDKINHWQQFACPVKAWTDDNKGYHEATMGIAEKKDKDITQDQNTATLIYNWDYSTDTWTKFGNTHTTGAAWDCSDMVPFAAYDLINNSRPEEGGIVYEFHGHLLGNEDMVLNFPESGFCIFGNGYTAPIDLTSLFAQIKKDINAETDEKESNIDPCVYIFNSSKDRFEECNALALYLAELKILDVPFSQIPPQQAFIMNLLKGNSGQTSVDYAKCVWGNSQNTNPAILAPRREQSNNLSAVVTLSITDGSSTDKVTLVESEDYDASYNQGADAQKYMEANTFNVFAKTDAGQLSMVATDNINHTHLSFNAGKSVTYTMTCTHAQGEYTLVDHLTNATVDLVEGATYSFVANANSTMDNRFEIIARQGVVTDIETVSADTAIKGVYTVLGQYVGTTVEWSTLPAGIYVIDGVKVCK